MSTSIGEFSYKLPSASQAVETPIDLIRLSIGNNVKVKCRGHRMLSGQLHAYDDHLNLVLGDVTEVITTIEVDEDTFEETISTSTRKVELLFVRGDTIIFVTSSSTSK